MHSKTIPLLALSFGLIFLQNAALAAASQAFTAECGVGQPVISGTATLPAGSDFSLVPVKAGVDFAGFAGQNDESCPPQYPQCNPDDNEYYSLFSATGCYTAQTTKAMSVTINGSTYSSAPGSWPSPKDDEIYVVCNNPLKALPDTTENPPKSSLGIPVNENYDPIYALKTAYAKQGMGFFAGPVGDPDSDDGLVLTDSYKSSIKLYFTITSTGAFVPSSFTASNPKMTCQMKLASGAATP